MVLTARHQIRVLTTGRMLVFDTLVKQWGESSINDGLDALLWNGAPAYLSSNGNGAGAGVRAELQLDGFWTGYAGTDYTLTAIDIETGWAKFDDSMQSRAVVDFVQLLGEFRSTCAVRVRLSKDFEGTAPDEDSGTGAWNYNTDKTWTPYPAIVGSALQLRQSPRWKRCEAIKARFTITNPDGVSPLGGPCVRLTSIGIMHALEPGAYGAIAGVQKQ